MRLLHDFLIFAVVLVVVFVGYHLGSTSVVQAKTPAAVAPTKTVAAAPDPLASLPADMNAAIAAAPDLSASATLINLNTGTVYNAGNYTQRYEAASTSKLVAIFDYINRVEQAKRNSRRTSTASRPRTSSCA